MWSKFLRLQDHRLSKSDRIFIVNALKHYGVQPQPLSIKQLPKEVKLSRTTLKKSIQYLSQIEVLDLQDVASDGTLLNDSTCSFSACFIDQVKLLSSPEPLFEEVIRRLLFNEKKPSSEDYFLAILVAHCNQAFRVVKQDFMQGVIPSEISINDLLSLTGLKKQTVYCYINRLKNSGLIDVTGIGLKHNSVCLFANSGIHIKINLKILNKLKIRPKIKHGHHPEIQINPTSEAEDTLFDRCIVKYLFTTKGITDEKGIIDYLGCFLQDQKTPIKEAFHVTVNHDFNIEKSRLALEGLIIYFFKMPAEHQLKVLIKGQLSYSICKDHAKNLIEKDLASDFLNFESHLKYFNFKHAKNNKNEDHILSKIIDKIKSNSSKNEITQYFERNKKDLQSSILIIIKKLLSTENKENLEEYKESFCYTFIRHLYLLFITLIENLINSIYMALISEGEPSNEVTPTDIVNRIQSIRALGFTYSEGRCSPYSVSLLFD